MSDKSLTLDAAAEIDRYTKASIAKINDNANALFSRIAEASVSSANAANGLDKIGRKADLHFNLAAKNAATLTAEVIGLTDKIKVAQSDIEELLHDLSIARAGVDGINAIIGKVVTLKSASDVKMTAARMADDGGVLCVWMHNGVVQSASIPLAALVDWP